MTRPPQYALGFRVKTGWAAVVLLGGGRSKTGPKLLDSRVIALSDPDEPESRQPYHAGFGTEQTDERRIVALTNSVFQFSGRTIANLIREYGKKYRVRVSQLVVSSFTDPATITNPHIRAHALEGRFFAAVLLEGLDRAGLAFRMELERDVYRDLAKALRRTVPRVKSQIAGLGDGTKPWRAEQKAACAAAWLVLAG